MLLLNGKRLTKEQIELCCIDNAIGGRALFDKYRIDQGGEHPIFTRKLWEKAKSRDTNNHHHTRLYSGWLWMRLNMVAQMSKGAPSIRPSKKS